MWALVNGLANWLGALKGYDWRSCDRKTQRDNVGDLLELVQRAGILYGGDQKDWVGEIIFHVCMSLLPQQSGTCSVGS